MNTTIRTTLALGLSALATVGLATTGAVAAVAAPQGTTTAAAVVDDDLVETLTYMREEERLARDLYAAIAELYDGARPFSRITNSEDHHFDAVGVLLDRYDIDDPSEGLAAGTYAVAELQELYDDLLAQAATSLEAAYDVGITIEEADIDDLGLALAADYPSDVDAVLENLLAGSENHLAAYTAAADGTLAGGASGNGGASGTAERGQGTMSGRDGTDGNAGRGAGRNAGGTGSADCRLTD